MNILNKKGEVIFSLSGAYSVGEALEVAARRSRPLNGAMLRNADLRNRELDCIRLNDACLDGANLSGACLLSAHLDGASCIGASFYSADLRHCDLRNVVLKDSKFTGADFKNSRLRPEDLEILVSEKTIVAEGVLIGYKKIYAADRWTPVICKLRIPARARRVGGVLGRKCRAEFAYVLEGEGFSCWKDSFKYTRGKLIRPDSYDPNPLTECSNGIHFFLTRREAENF